MFKGYGAATRLKDSSFGLAYRGLDTGVSQSEELGLFTNLAYRRRGPFGQDLSSPYNVFMQK